MNNCEKLVLAYTGSAVESGQIDVRDLGGALMAIGSLFYSANNRLNAERAKIEIKVNALRDGSFEIDLSLIQTIRERAISLFTSRDITALNSLLSLLGLSGGAVGLFKLMKLIQGRKITHMNKKGNGVIKISVEGTEIEINEKVLELYQDIEVRKSVQAMVKPLQNEGIDGFEVRGGDVTSLEIDSKEINFFDTNIEQEALGDFTKEIHLTVESLSFKQGNKWKFSDGELSFFAKIEDSDFINSIFNEDIAFRRSDVLKVEMRTRQAVDSLGHLKTEHTIVKVLEYRPSPRARQLDLFSRKKKGSSEDNK